ncbi:transmembrane protein 165-like isoform X1 [Stegodyphus dumicola]|uniref:transmembrane protein 165-like isoform X1 n=1 Tax=Stegodyphus dumicola TaxID=202533 RepID=UPI0015ADB772|nr:transmembrane protein 165-like isoform X1 [Stegodyphus dumicola]
MDIINFTLCFFILSVWFKAKAETIPTDITFTDTMLTETAEVVTIPLCDANETCQPVTPDFAAGAFSAFSVIIVSEFGDKTFFIAVVLALSHSVISVFGGAMLALILMTALSAGLGLVSSLIPVIWMHYLSALLFFLFGIKMLREGYLMSSTAGKEEFEGVQRDLDTKMAAKAKDLEAGSPKSVIRWVFLEAFVMTFLAEWGDRSQITTVILAAKHSVVGVVLGAVLGHAVCTLVAVMGGKIVADRISLRVVTIVGGILFLAFAVYSLLGIADNSSPPLSSS